MSSWFQSTNIASLAKNALKEAQKTIDKALDINQESSGEEPSPTSEHTQNHLSDLTNTVTGAATEFFNTWGVPGILKESTDSVQDVPATNAVTSKSQEIVVTSPPHTNHKPSTSKSSSSARSKARKKATTPKSSRPAKPVVADNTTINTDTFTELSLSDGDETKTHGRNTGAADGGDGAIREDLDNVSNNPDPLQNVQNFTFQPLWLETESQSEPCEISSSLIDLEPSAANSTEQSRKMSSDVCLAEQPEAKDEEHPTILVNFEEDTISGAKPSDPKPVPTSSVVSEQLTPEPTHSVVTESYTESTESSQSTSENEDRTSRSHLNSESDTTTTTITDLESSSATLMQDSRDNSDEADADPAVTLNRSNPVEEPSRNENAEGNLSPPMSPSSRAMSSVSVMSDEKTGSHESESGPCSPTNSTNSGPSSPNEHGSQMLLAIKESARGPRHQPSSSSTPDKGHSRSNSNSTSSSAGGDQQHHGKGHSHHSQAFHPSIPSQNQSQVYQSGGRIIANFPLSSASSSDIEVIPLDSLDSSMILHGQPGRRRPSSVEVETQTDASTTTASEVPTNTKMSNILAEKDAEIAQLREEGEKLSKKQFDLTSIIKKLRAKEKDTETTIKNLKKEIDTKSIEVERVTKTFLQKESIEQKQVQTISALNNEKTKLEDTISELRSKLEDATENCASMKASLEDASIEILELQNTIATAQENTTQVDTLTREKSSLHQQNLSYKKEIDQLRASLSSMQAKSSTREQDLNAQLVAQSQKVQLLETQLGDVTDEIADATMPLSIEIEKLQSELKANELQFQKRERQLNDQIRELNLKLKQSLEREKSSQEYEVDYKSAISQLENQMERLENENKNLCLQVRKLEDDGADANERQKSLEIRLEEQKQELEKTHFIIEKLETDLKGQTSMYEAEKKKCNLLMEQVRQAQFQQHDDSGNTTPVRPIRSPTTSEASYLEDVFESNHLNNNIGNSRDHHGPGLLTPKSSSMFDNLPIYNQASVSPYLETLYAQLRLRENELVQLQSDSVKNEKIRKTLNDEIAKLTVENQQLDGKLEQLTDVQDKLTELEKNYNAVLQLYGEKVEEVEELRMDLADVKEMFKTQIEQLVKKE